jgi:hypothetical protein
LDSDDYGVVGMWKFLSLARFSHNISIYVYLLVLRLSVKFWVSDFWMY